MVLNGLTDEKGQIADMYAFEGGGGGGGATANKREMGGAVGDGLVSMFLYFNNCENYISFMEYLHLIMFFSFSRGSNLRKNSWSVCGHDQSNLLFLDNTLSFIDSKT
jgi:hypothetical protein